MTRACARDGSALVLGSSNLVRDADLAPAPDRALARDIMDAAPVTAAPATPVAALLVPLGRLRDLQEGTASTSLLVRYAHRGQRLLRAGAQRVVADPEIVAHVDAGGEQPVVALVVVLEHLVELLVGGALVRALL